MAFKDMRDFLGALEEAGQLKQVDIPLNCERGNNELQELMRHLAQTDGPGLILNNLIGYNRPDVPVIFNPFGTRERTAMTIGLTDTLEAKKKHAKILSDEASWHKPVLVERADALCKQNVISKDDISLGEQLPTLWFGKEGASYICGGVVVSEDPETGERNVGWYRLTQFFNAQHPTGGSYSEERQQKNLSIFAFWNPPMSHVGLHLAKARRLGKPLKIAVAVMCDPAVHLAACTAIPAGHDEFAFAGGLRGAPVELVKCETSDLEVPAVAEWVIECTIEPDSDDETIGWHSNSVGYYDKVQTFPAIDVDCITHRDEPYWYATMEMMPPFDHNYIALIPGNRLILAGKDRQDRRCYALEFGKKLGLCTVQVDGCANSAVPAGQEERERASETEAQSTDFSPRRRVLVEEFRDRRFEIRISAIQFEFLRQLLCGHLIIGDATVKEIGCEGYETRSGQPIANVANEFRQPPLIVDDDDPATEFRRWFGEIGRRNVPVSASCDSLVLDVGTLSPNRHRQSPPPGTQKIAQRPPDSRQPVTIRP